MELKQQGNFGTELRKVLLIVPYGIETFHM